MSAGVSPDAALCGTFARCDPAGGISEVLRDDLGLLAGRPAHFADVIAAPDKADFARFLAAAAARQPTFNASFDVTLCDQVERLCFGATSGDGHIVVFVARTRASLARLNDALAEMAAGRAEGAPDTLPTTRFEPASQEAQRAGEDRALYEDLSRLNNELAATQRKLVKANRLLDGANIELRAFYESLHVGIFRADLTGRIELANQRFCVLTGGTLPDHWLSHVHPRDAEAVLKLWREAIDLRGDFDSVHRQLIEGAPARFVEMKAVTLRDVRNRPIAIVGVVEDVSERLLAEKQARDLARYASIHGLTGGLAHNLNNIMTVLLSTADMLCEELPPTHPAHRTATLNLEATERAADLTHRLLVYSGQDVYAFERRMDVDVALRALLEDPKIAGACTFTLNLKATGAVIMINATLFGEMILELVSNAVAAMPEGGAIEISTSFDGEAADPDRMIVVAVEDHGCGMEEKVLQRAKEPFFTTREVGQGIGLGLSLADGAARMARGTLALRSRGGQGTTAELRFPTIDGSGEAAPSV